MLSRRKKHSWTVATAVSRRDAGICGEGTDGVNGGPTTLTQTRKQMILHALAVFEAATSYITIVK